MIDMGSKIRFNVAKFGAKVASQVSKFGFGSGNSLPGYVFYKIAGHGIDGNRWILCGLFV